MKFHSIFFTEWGELRWFWIGTLIIIVPVVIVAIFLAASNTVDYELYTYETATGETGEAEYCYTKYRSGLLLCEKGNEKISVIKYERIK